ncbi:trypsin beta-like [Bacillus rossius redtenbacheri]|uniref:trypsin beta-like n=1 Tax=Bacillus rossius redtenbacheri TaxID=93214 RepID=UPI002FDEA001
MFRILAAYSLLISAYGASIKDDFQLDGRIVGGHAITINQAPYQVGFQINGAIVCGGSILSPTFVLTAAHCTEGHAVSAVSIRAGSSYRSRGGTVHAASQIINHASYTTRPLTNYDIALVKVAKPFAYGATVRPVALATAVPAAGSAVVAAGWGQTSEGGATSEQLQQVQTSIVAQASCNEAYFNELQASMLCAGDAGGGKDTCSQDSGGPLVHSGQQVGVVSFGMGCGRKGYPGVYASVPYFRAWIKQHAGV